MITAQVLVSREQDISYLRLGFINFHHLYIDVYFACPFLLPNFRSII